MDVCRPENILLAAGFLKIFMKNFKKPSKQIENEENIAAQTILR